MQLSTRELTLSAIVSDNKIDGVEIILGMDVIDALGGVIVTRNTVQFCELEGDMLSTYSFLIEVDDFLDKESHITDRGFSADFYKDI